MYIILALNSRYLFILNAVQSIRYPKRFVIVDDKTTHVIYVTSQQNMRNKKCTALKMGNWCWRR